MVGMVSEAQIRAYPYLWQLSELGSTNDLLHAELECLWNHYLSDGDWPDFELLFAHFGRSLHFIANLERFPFVRNFQKELFDEMQAYSIENESLHDVIYDHHKDELIAKLVELIESVVGFFERVETEMGEQLREKWNEEGGEEHPIYELLERRDRIAYILMGVRYRQTEESPQYVTINVDLYDHRLRVADFTLRKLVLFTIQDIKYREVSPYAPRDFWWRHLPGYEFDATALLQE